MQRFNLQSHLDTLYACFPQAGHQPIIGLTANFAAPDASLCERYYNQVVAAGATPVIIPPVSNTEVIVNTLDQLDALILTGGADYNPLWAGEQPQLGLHHINARRDLPELLITRLAYDRNIPILGICRGIQALAMAFGGTVVQDIQPGGVKHSQDADRNLPTHTVSTEDGSVIRNIYGETVCVNSFHHQAVGKTGPLFRVTATAPDGTIEAIESTAHRPVIGVQWHPEWLEEEGLKLFQWLADQARNFHTAKQLHRRILTLDTHVDTPMFFHQGIHFDQRDQRIKCDLQKMTDGRQDAVIMAAYLPQPKMGEQFSQKVKMPADPHLSSLFPHPTSPFSYANLIFDQIEQIVKTNSRYLSIARTPADLYEDKRKGRRSIMLAIENGLALEHDLANLRHFAQRGIVYMTLCHNGDNDICDSARGCNTHQGMSRFGQQVIQEMNRLGIMVDLSHAAEKSFYDAADISAAPIVCSHSSCRALCDHPRNLTDDQMRLLARQGGVMQVTLYPGFLRKDGQASILDAIAHLEHAVSIMGIDHVGIGTDFDGDGGVTGFNDSSEAVNFTLHLLRRKYSERDIQKIWGGNWLRVMTAVQKRP
ncbi:MAG: membrane dipeptidase [Prevotella sp.]|nr:membrane dipeptidase [Prevotella sp.]